jgi:pimeloyl-ACP methyl ester carboxylesterase
VTRVVLVHGAATDSRVWLPAARALRDSGATVEVPDRPQSGDLDLEVEFLTPMCQGAHVLGISGGATLGLELAARGVEVASALLHEPAAGSLAPGLLTQVAEGLAADGVAGFGRALYGPSWTMSTTKASLETVGRELAMFGAFEPRPLGVLPDRVVLTVGQRSPLARHDSVWALSGYLGVRRHVLAGAGHAAYIELAEAFAERFCRGPVSG